MHDIANTIKTEVEFFAENGFLGPFKLYEPEQAREILQTVRAKRQ